MRDLVDGSKRKASFLGSHFMALCLGLLILVLAISMLSNCRGASSASPTSSATRTYATTTSSSVSPTDTSGLRTVAFADLPSQAQATIALIDKGGPFPYSRDGITFSNFDGLLPKERSGYYKEYTVPTPGASTRGARRIIVGQDGTMYYTSDHYKSFRRIVR